MSFQKILVAFDHSPLDEEIYRQAVDLAKAQRSQLLLLHCVDVGAATAAVSLPPPSGGSGLGVYPTAGMGVQPIQPMYAVDWQETLQQRQEWLQSYHQQASNQGIPTQIDCQVGRPQERICEAARNWLADLIIVGRRGRRGLTEVLLGSVSNHVVHHAPCAVLVIQGVEESAAYSASSP